MKISSLHSKVDVGLRAQVLGSRIGREDHVCGQSPRPRGDMRDGEEILDRRRDFESEFHLRHEQSRSDVWCNFILKGL